MVRRAEVLANKKPFFPASQSRVSQGHEFEEFHYFQDSPDPEIMDGIVEPPIEINSEKCFV